MDYAVLLQYLWVLVILIALEGILAADNALVMAIMVKHLPEKQRKRALFYGLAGAFVFRFGSLFAISFLVDVWQVQAIGAIYLFFLAINHLVRKFVLKNRKNKTGKEQNSGFWMTVLKVEIADIAFAVDSILAAIALSVTLPRTNLPIIGGMDGGHFLVVFTGGLVGLIIMRFAATFFVGLLHRKPGLETAAYLVVGWVGVKLGMYTLAHPSIDVISHDFVESTVWKLIFWSVLILLFVLGWFLSKEVKDTTELTEEQVVEAEELIEEAEEQIEEHQVGEEEDSIVFRNKDKV
ncbi:YkoY family integral membrane protein [Bacillus horti]|uniref:YkoY family integral membrane protein n=1 Tax=Caldalkalibacillus horti TaxID=77523 RepID=A0ABT9VW43_9BACI|nr:TerC family protein [Bacillus horti]MDQ0165192.1 YkoY family integral membrane protein [Bacillus horti]